MLVVDNCAKQIENKKKESKTAFNDKGQLKEEYLELFQLLDINSNKGIEFNGFFQEILKKLVPDFDFETNIVNIYLVDDNTVNAGALIKDDNCAILLNKGLLESAQNLDQIIFVLGHELRHFISKLDWKPKETTKYEELASDNYPLVWMNEAGYNPVEGLNFLKELGSSDLPLETYEKAKILANDVHPAKQTRVSSAKATLAILNRKTPKKHNTTSIPKKIIDIKDDFTFISYTDYLKTQNHYQQATSNEKIDILISEIEKIELNSYKIRGIDLIDLFIEVTDEIADQNIKIETYNQLFSIIETEDKHYGYLAKNCSCWSATNAGIEFNSAVEKFVNANDKLEILNSASKLNELYSKYKTQQDNSIFNLIFQNTSIPYTQNNFQVNEITKNETYLEIIAPWDSHVKIALESDQEELKIIDQALLTLGINDPRIIKDTDLKWNRIRTKFNLLKINCNIDANYLMQEDGKILIYSKKEIENTKKIADVIKLGMNQNRINLINFSICNQVLGLKEFEEKRSNVEITNPINVSWLHEIKDFDTETFYQSFQSIFDSKLDTGLIHPLTKILRTSGRNTATEYLMNFMLTKFEYKANLVDILPVNQDLIDHISISNEIISQFKAIEEKYSGSENLSEYILFIREFYLGRDDGRDINFLVDISTLSGIPNTNINIHPYTEHLITSVHFSLKEKINFLSESLINLEPHIVKKLFVIHNNEAELEILNELSLENHNIGKIASRFIINEILNDNLNQDISKMLVKYPGLFLQIKAVRGIDFEKLISKFRKGHYNYIQIEESILAFKLLEILSVFDQESKKYLELKNNILNKLNEQTDPNKKIELALSLIKPIYKKNYQDKKDQEDLSLLELYEDKLKSKNILIDSFYQHSNISSLQDKDLRTKAFEVIANEVKNKFGIDKQSKEYESVIKDFILNLNEQLTDVSFIKDRYNLLWEIAEKLEFQPPLCKFINILFKDFEQDLIRKSNNYYIIEVILEELKEDPKRRYVLLEYLSNELTYESIKKLSNHLDFDNRRKIKLIEFINNYTYEIKMKLFNCHLLNAVVDLDANEQIVLFNTLTEKEKEYLNFSTILSKHLFKSYNCASKIEGDLVLRIDKIKTSFSEFITKITIIKETTDNEKKIEKIKEYNLNVNELNKQLKILYKLNIISTNTQLPENIKKDHFRDLDVSELKILDFNPYKFCSNFGVDLKYIIKYIEKDLENFEVSYRFTTTRFIEFEKNAKAMLKNSTNQMPTTLLSNYIDKNNLDPDYGSWAEAMEFILSNLEEINPNTREINLCSDIHNRYWSLSKPERIVFTDRLLYSSKDEASDFENQEFLKSFNLMLNTVFPKELKYSSHARKILRSYVLSIPEFERSLLVSSLLAATEKDKIKENVSIGKRLATILSPLGPGERKLLQAISSHVQIPLEIRRDTQEAKYQSFELENRLIIIDRISSLLSKEQLADIIHFGRIKSSASYYVVSEIYSKTHGHCALAILKENAEEQAINGLKYMSASITDLKEKEYLTEGTQIGTELIEHTQNLVAIETNCITGKMQHSIIKDNQHGLIIQIADKNLSFSVPEWHYFDKEYRLMDFIEGKHFFEFPENTAQEIELKSVYAKAIFTKVLLSVLEGKEIDSDRHFGQYIIKDDTIHILDHGCTMLLPPKDTEIKEVAQFFVNFITQYLSRTNKVSIQSISKEVDKKISELKSEQETIPEYLISINKLFLSAGDFLKSNQNDTFYLKKEDFISIMNSIITSQKIHPIFMHEFLNKLVTTNKHFLLPTKLKKILNDKNSLYKKENMDYICKFISKRVNKEYPNLEAITISK